MCFAGLALVWFARGKGRTPPVYCAAPAARDFDYYWYSTEHYGCSTVLLKYCIYTGRRPMLCRCRLSLLSARRPRLLPANLVHLEVCASTSPDYPGGSYEAWLQLVGALVLLIHGLQQRSGCSRWGRCVFAVLATAGGMGRGVAVTCSTGFSRGLVAAGGRAGSFDPWAAAEAWLQLVGALLVCITRMEGVRCVLLAGMLLVFISG